ncbi:MAG: polysaccharide pyruvyl transferase family protein, partial [Bacteroidales bacterium]|nr:polysaccharide pyruvyl transferase family protein [Bacteroidales bacterium]
MSKDILYPLRWLHGQAYEAKIRHKTRQDFRKQFQEMRKQNPKTVFLVMTPEHGNLGDHAIAYAETTMLKKLGIDYLEVTGRQLDEWKYQGVLDLMNGYPILINGGGNLGTLWMSVEEIQRDIMRKNSRSPIIILPNTMFYEDSDWGREEFEKSVQCYNRHRRLHLYAREKNSYEVMRKVYHNVKLIPDMVLSLNQCGRQQMRHGCLLCLRGDCEKTRTEEQEQIIRQQAVELFGNDVLDTDMVVNHRIAVEQREAALQVKFDEFSAAELVITDRLHGMVFCAITGTSCIVLNSKSHKLHGCY